MATPSSSGSAVPSSSPSGSSSAGPEETQKEKAVKVAQSLMKEHQRITGTLSTFDYEPLFIAIAERSVTLDFEMLEKMLSKKASGNPWTSQWPVGGWAGVGWDKRPPKQAGDGCWDHVQYVPPWSDPELDPQREELVQGERQARKQRDVLTLRRPALRTADLVRNPTDYAKRFGVWPDRTDGRSRCSPSTSATRGNAAYQGQLELMPDSERALLVAETQRRIWQGVSTWDPHAGPVDQAVLDDWMASQTLPTLQKMRMWALDQDISYQEAVETLPPKLHTLYRPMIDEILADEDVQRIIFCDMTMDEMIAGNVHTMANDQSSDLTGPLHPLVDRVTWEDTLRRGTSGESPRFLYNLQGKRMEWDVHRNDEVWTALQPALQMVSRVLNSNPRFWTSLKDLGTRMAVPDSLDPRTDEEKIGDGVARLTRFAPLDEKDDVTWPDTIVELQNLGFDFEYWTDYLLLNCLRIGLGRANFGRGKLEEEAYGRTELTHSQTDFAIDVEIAADNVWPLLVDGYSSSEKLCSSIIVAGTLLHEIMHATSAAQYLMLQQLDYWFPAGLSQDIYDLLKKLGKDLLSKSGAIQEPYWYPYPASELGFAFEENWYGMQISTLTNLSANTRRSADHMHAPIIAAVSSVLIDPEKCLNVTIPPQVHGMGLPIDYYASIFTEAWWNTTFASFGQVAFQQLPPKRTHWGIKSEGAFGGDAMCAVLGGQNHYRFFDLVVALLSASGLNILSLYLYESIYDMCRAETLRFSWEQYDEHWAMQEDNFNRLMTDVADVVSKAADNRSDWVYPGPEPNLVIQKYQEYVQNQLSVQQAGAPAIMSQDEFVAAKQRDTAEYFAHGGNVQRRLMEVDARVRKSVSVFQRLIFDFLTLSNTDRCRVFNYRNTAHEVENALVALHDRIDNFVEPVRSLELWCEKAATGIPDFEKWASYFSQHHTLLVELRDILHNHHTILDDQAQQIRRSFASVPSGPDKRGSTRLRALAMKEYAVLDSRIRKAVDEVKNQLRIISLGRIDLFPAPPDPDQLSGKLTELITKPQAAATQQQQHQDNSGPSLPAPGPFTWQKPNPQQLAQLPPLRQETQFFRSNDPAPPTILPAAPPAALAGAPAVAPALVPAPDPVLATAYNFLAPASIARAPWTQPANAAAFQVPQLTAGQGFGQYAADGPAWTAVGPSQQQLGGPFGYGGGTAVPPAVGGEDRSAYEPNSLMPSVRPFGAPYADRTTMTSDLANVLPDLPSQVDPQALGMHTWRERWTSSDVDEDGDDIMTT